MSLLDIIFGRSQPQPSDPEHAVIVAFQYGSTNLDPIFTLEEELEQAIAQASSGEFDGNEIAADGADGTLYMYGPDAESLFASVRPVLEACPFMDGAVVRLRYGPPGNGVRETEYILGSIR